MRLPRVRIISARCPNCGPAEDFRAVGYKRGPLPYSCTARVLRRWRAKCWACFEDVLLETEPEATA